MRNNLTLGQQVLLIFHILTQNFHHMKICLIGYGKMGKAIENQAIERGHVIKAKVDSKAQGHIQELVKDCDVAIEFTKPEAAIQNILRCFQIGIPVVCGTTGWTAHWKEIEDYVRQYNGSLIWASNFSVGVNIFFEINSALAKIMSSQHQYSTEIKEVHHIHKLDSPSGTGITIAQQIIDAHPSYKSWKLRNESEKSSDELIIDAIREGEVIGYHEVKYSSSIDEIKLSHNAFNRNGFALGAVLAAEWLIGKKGIFSMKDVLGFQKT